MRLTTALREARSVPLMFPRGTSNPVIGTRLTAITEVHTSVKTAEAERSTALCSAAGGLIGAGLRGNVPAHPDPSRARHSS